ncbi:MAG TPA: hypothetical protein VJN71_03470 [Nitrososphaerales archaeon]|nr:hypothetical protein [Nitrososphaerales archaeon]
MQKGLDFHGTSQGIESTVELYQKESPMVLISLPLNLGKNGLRSLLCLCKTSKAFDSFDWVSAEYPTMSVNIIADSLRCPWDNLAILK